MIRISKKYPEKFEILKENTENFSDFLLFLAGIKSKVEILTKQNIKIELDFKDRKDIFSSRNFRLYKALSCVKKLGYFGIAELKSDNLAIHKDGIDIVISDLWKYNWFLEFPFYDVLLRELSFPKRGLYL